jgi:hypothetical protein
MKLMSSIEKSEIEKWQDNLMEYKVKRDGVKK